MFEGYARDIICYPLGVSPSCHKNLSVAKTKGSKAVSETVRTSWNIDYGSFQLQTRKTPCDCCICHRFDNGEQKKKADVFRSTGVDIEEENDAIKGSRSTSVTKVLFVRCVLTCPGPSIRL